MSRRSRSESKSKRKIKSIYIFPVLFAIICLSYVFRFIFYNVGTEIVKYDTIENVISTEGVIIKNEWVVPLPVKAQFDAKVNEGERVPYGKRLAELSGKTSTDENIAIKIQELNERIAEIKKNNTSNSFFAQDKEKLDDNIKVTAEEIKKQSKAGNLTKLEDSKKVLAANLYKKSLVSGRDSFYGKNYNDLVNEKKALEEMYINSGNIIYSKSSGIVSYELDGLEQVLSPAKIVNFKVNGIKQVIADLEKAEKSKNKKQNSPGIKIINNYEWYVSAIIPANDTIGLSNGKSIRLKFKDLGGIEVNAIVFAVSKPENGECLLTMKTNEYLKDFYKCRLANIDIIKESYSGYGVPLKSIVNRDKTKGLYVIRRGLVKFIPVEVLAIEGKKAVVRNASGKAQNDDAAAGLKVFDEIITTVKNVKENQVLLNKI